jgi:predicted transposase YbfD/YdcC
MTFLDNFETIVDDRSYINKSYELTDIIFLTMAAILSGAKGWKSIHLFGTAKLTWLRQFRPFVNGIPTRHSIGRIIRGIKAQSLVDCFELCVNEVREQNGKEHISFDGKVIRGSRHGESVKAIQLMSAMVTSTGLILTMEETPDKENEIPIMQSMLKALSVEGTIISADAMHCQTKTAKISREEGADYVLQVKLNQKKLLEEIEAYFHKVRRDDLALYNKRTFKEIDGEHGRIYERFYRLLPITDWCTEAARFKDSHSLIEVTRNRTIKGETKQEISYYITSADEDVKKIAGVIRNHWAIENSQHWVLDVTFREDERKIYADDGARNMCLFRRWLMNMIKAHPVKDSVNGKMMRAAWDDEFRTAILFGADYGKV